MLQLKDKAEVRILVPTVTLKAIIWEQFSSNSFRFLDEHSTWISNIYQANNLDNSLKKLSLPDANYFSV